MTTLKNKKIVYLFTSGRNSRINSNQNFAKEFFYSYFALKEINEETSISEIKNIKVFLINYIDKLIQKLTRFPLSLTCFFNKKLKKDLFNAEIILLVNESVMFYTLPLLIFKKIFNRKLKIKLFTMGLFSEHRKKNKLDFLRKFVLKSMCIKFIDTFFCLGESEYNFIIKNYPKEKEKFKYINFGIDSNFWKSKSKYNLKSRDYILFIGNDLNRDYEFLIKLINSMEEINFKILSTRLNKNDFHFTNVEVINGVWWKNVVSDNEIKDLYEHASMTILPLKDTLQPSGQSVALQSMSMGTPVMLTETKGLWDLKNLKNNKNIFLMKENNVKLWKSKITENLSDADLLDTISLNGIEIIKSYYNIESFDKSVINNLNLKTLSQ